MVSIPLYLQDSSVGSVELDDSGRLRIINTPQTEKKIPLRFISRIICRSDINIAANVIVACMKKGIPISIMDRKGETIGWCMGILRRASTLQNLLLHALDDPEWDRHYTAWLTNQRMAIVYQTLLICDVSATPVALESPRTVLFNRLRQKHGVPCGKLFNRVARLAQEELAAILIGEIGNPSLLALARPGVNLITDLGDLLSIHVHVDLYHSSRITCADDLGTWATKYYQKHSAHWAYRISPLVHSFTQFLRQNWL